MTSMFVKCVAGGHNPTETSSWSSRLHEAFSISSLMHVLPRTAVLVYSHCSECTFSWRQQAANIKKLYKPTADNLQTSETSCPQSYRPAGEQSEALSSERLIELLLRSEQRIFYYRFKKLYSQESRRHKTGLTFDSDLTKYRAWCCPHSYCEENMQTFYPIQ